MSPDFSKLAYLQFDSSQPGLTAGALRPANTVQVIDLAALNKDSTPEFALPQTLYAATADTEFLAPDLAWTASDRLIAVRSRFTLGSAPTLERFGFVDLQLPSTVDGAAVVNNFLLPGRQALQAVVPCQVDQSYLMVVENRSRQSTPSQSGSSDNSAQSENEIALELVRWDKRSTPEPIFGLPVGLSRVLLCWQSTLE
jgi:hypothetical protein